MPASSHMETVKSEIRQECGMHFPFRLHKQLESMRIILVVLITLHYSINNFAGTILDAVPSVNVERLMCIAYLVF